MAKKLQSALHHWWPKALSRFWADRSGHTYRVECNGKLISAPPGEFGAIRNDNNIRLGDVPSVWDESFEAAFDKADGGFGHLIAWLQTLSSPIPAKDASFTERLTPIAVTDENRALLGECLASLIIRSPSFRNRVRLNLGHIRKRFGFPDPTPEKKLIGLNVRDGQRMLAEVMAAGGKFAVLLSGDNEFIFGDGFMHNVVSVANTPHFPQCLVPLTPEIAIFYTRPSACLSGPPIYVMNLTPEEVSFVNETIQVYASRYLFFREIHPVIVQAFSQGEHRQYQYDRHPWTVDLEQTIAGTPFATDMHFMMHTRIS